MASEADKVVVELVANVDKFNADVKTSASGFTASMGQIEQSAGRAEKSHARLSLAANNNRIAMLELQHVVRGSTDQFAAGAPLTQIFAQHVASVGEAAVLAGGSMGKFGAILANPWAQAAVAATAIIVTLIAKHHEEGAAVDDLVEKLRKHYEQANLQAQADDIWAKSIDGLLDSLKKLDDELQKQIGLTEKTPQDKLAEALTKRTQAQDDFNKALARQRDLEAQLAKAQEEPGIVSGVAGAVVHGANPEAVDLQKQLEAQRIEVQKTERAWLKAGQAVRDAGVAAGQAIGEATADATKHIDDLAKTLTTKVAKAGSLILDPQDVAAAQTALEDYKNAEEAAAAKGLDFAKIGAENEVKRLTDSFARGVTPVDAYTKRIEALAAALQKAAEQAKEDPIAKFKQSVIGAEGLGNNPLSSAAGFGQFLAQKAGQPLTEWQTYFKQVFAEQAKDMTAAEIDAMRSKRPVAEAIIDRATQDYVALLKKMRQDITAANLYTVHVLGAPDAKKFFAASPNQSVASALGGGAHAQSVVANNGNLFSGTVAQAQAQLAKRIGDSSATISAGVAALAQLQEQEKEREARYIAEKSGLEEQVIEARKGFAKEAIDIWGFETAANIAVRKHTDDEIAAQEAASKLLPEEAKELRRINDERAKYRQQLVDQRLRQAQFAAETQNLERGRDFQTASYETEAEVLRSRLEAEQGLAQDSKSRREIEQRLIDLQFQEERLKNQYIIDWAERVKANKDATEAEKHDAELAEEIAKMHNGTLDQRHANATQGNNQQNASPLQSYFNSIPQTADRINDALEGIAVHGLQTFNDALTDAIVNFHSLGDVGRAVLTTIESDLIKLALQLIEQHTIGLLLASTGLAAQAPIAAATTAMWAGPAALASLATFGANAAPAIAAMGTTLGAAIALGSPKARGGRINGIGTDTSDTILTPTSPDEYVIRASSARALGYDTLDYLNAHGALPQGFANGGRIQPMNLTAASPSSAGIPGITRDDIRRLETAIRESQASISLHPTLHPAQALDAALSSSAGQKRMFGFFKDNSTALKAHLNRPGS